MHIDWAAFGQVFVVSFAVAVGLIVLFAIGVSLLSSPAPDPDGRHSAHPSPGGAAARPTSLRAPVPAARRLTAWGCFLACALCVAYGLYVVVAR